VQQGLGLNPILNLVLIPRKLGSDQRGNLASVMIQDPPRFESDTTMPCERGPQYGVATSQRRVR
jgi:hypothetical protein